jgi:HEPN domain-containing protein
MPPKSIHGSPEDWLRRAHASLALAKVQGDGILLEDLCYRAQQAAEKAMKALYIARGKEFLFTHDLDRLIMGLEAIGIEITETIDQATILTRYAIEARYAGGFEPVVPTEYLEAVRLAETVLAWVSGHLSTQGD